MKHLIRIHPLGILNLVGHSTEGINFLLQLLLIFFTGRFKLFLEFFDFVLLVDCAGHLIPERCSSLSNWQIDDPLCVLVVAVLDLFVDVEGFDFFFEFFVEIQAGHFSCVVGWVGDLEHGESFFLVG